MIQFLVYITITILLLLEMVALQVHAQLSDRIIEDQPSLKLTTTTTMNRITPTAQPIQNITADIQRIQNLTADRPLFIISTNGTMTFALNSTSQQVVGLPTPDAGALINYIIDKLPNGGSIGIIEGNYLISTAIRPKTNISIFGEGPDKTILTPAKENIRIILNEHPVDPSLGFGDRNIALGNFTIDLKGSINSDIVNLVSVDGARIFQMIIKNSPSKSDALDFDGSDNILVEAVKFFDIGGSAIHISDSYKEWTNHRACNNITVIDAYASNVGKIRQIAAFNINVRSTPSSANNNTFAQIIVENSYGGVMFPAYGSGTKLIDSIINGSDVMGVHIRGVNGIIANTTIIHSGSEGIRITDSGNTLIQNVSVSKTNGSNIAVAKSSHINIKDIQLGDVLSNNHPYILLRTSSFNLIEGITIMNSKSQLLPKDLIKEEGTSDYNRIVIPNQLIPEVKKMGSHTRVDVTEP